MIYRKTRLSRRRMIWLLTHPLPHSPVSKLALFHSLRVCRRPRLLTGVGGAKSYNCEKAWSFINHSILLTLSIPPVLLPFDIPSHFPFYFVICFLFPIEVPHILCFLVSSPLLLPPSPSHFIFYLLPSIFPIYILTYPFLSSFSFLLQPIFYLLSSIFHPHIFPSSLTFGLRVLILPLLPFSFSFSHISSPFLPHHLRDLFTATPLSPLPSPPRKIGLIEVDARSSESFSHIGIFNPAL
jgi:hypothetical protein